MESTTLSVNAYSPRSVIFTDDAGFRIHMWTTPHHRIPGLVQVWASVGTDEEYIAAVWQTAVEKEPRSQIVRRLVALLVECGHAPAHFEALAHGWAAQEQEAGR